MNWILITELLAFIGLNVVDVITTMKALDNKTGVELNPISNFFFKLLPEKYWWVSKLIVMGIPLGIILYVGGLQAEIALGILCAVFGYVVYNNYKVAYKN